MQQAKVAEAPVEEASEQHDVEETAVVRVLNVTLAVVSVCVCVLTTPRMNWSARPSRNATPRRKQTRPRQPRRRRTRNGRVYYVAERLSMCTYLCPPFFCLCLSVYLSNTRYLCVCLCLCVCRGVGMRGCVGTHYDVETRPLRRTACLRSCWSPSNRRQKSRASCRTRCRRRPLRRGRIRCGH